MACLTASSRSLLAGAMVVVVASSPARAATAAADLSTVLKPVLAAHPDVPGLFGAIVDHGQLTGLGAVGLRKAGSTVAVTADDQVHLGSDTKAMTALLVGQLVRDHRLAWTETMADLFPDDRAGMDAAMARVTVADLLHHTAGLPHDLPWAELNAGGKPLADQRRSAVRLALSAKPTTRPGGTFAYSNVGYVILGAIVERKTGHPWEQVVADRVFHPLGMTTAGFGPPGTVGAVDQPWGHLRSAGRLTPVQVDNPPVMAPAGEVHCSMADWAKFVAVYCRTAGDGVPDVIDRRTLAALTTPSPGGSYAGGWLVTARPWGGGRVLTHAGSNTTWYCVAWVAPAKGFAVLAAANVAGDDATQACDEVAASLIRRHAAGSR